jgi:cyclic pyranopterin phosphate synthase
LITDKLGRQFRNLRVSLTAACNYACTYCVPAGEKRHSAKRELDAQALLQIVYLLQGVCQLEKLRITGGEPLVAEQFDEFLRKLDMERFKDVSLTTNGQLLAKKIPLIKEKGI